MLNLIICFAFGAVAGFLVSLQACSGDKQDSIRKGKMLNRVDRERVQAQAEVGRLSIENCRAVNRVEHLAEMLEEALNTAEVFRGISSRSYEHIGDKTDREALVFMATQLDDLKKEAQK
jgi:hypothetical protein